MTIKEIKKYKKEIEILKRQNPNKMQDKINEMLNRILKENGKESYEQEVETMFDNLLYYYVHKGERMPNQCYDLAIQFAEILIEKDNLQRAEEVVLSAASIQKEKSEIEQVKQAEEKEFIALRDEILKINELKSKKLGKRDIESYNIFLQMAKKHDIEQIKGEIFSHKGERNTNIEPNPPVNPTKEKPLPEYLLPEHRFEFIEKCFPGRKLRIFEGMANFADYLIIEIEGIDSVIVEKFFDKTKDGKVKITEGTDATYIIPKEFVLELQKISKTGLNELRENNPRIQKQIHKSGTIKPEDEYVSPIQFDCINYYRKFKTKFNTSVGYEFFEGFGFEDKPTRKKPKVHAKEKYKENKKYKEKIKKLADESKEDNIEEPNKEENASEIKPVLTKRELEEKLAIKLQEIQNYTSELREAIAKKQETTKISESLRQTVEELEKIQKQIGEMRED